MENKSSSGSKCIMNFTNHCHTVLGSEVSESDKNQEIDNVESKTDGSISMTMFFKISRMTHSSNSCRIIPTSAGKLISFIDLSKDAFVEDGKTINTHL